MLSVLPNLLALTSMLVCLFAFWKGGTAERIAAAIILTNFVVATANYATARSQFADLCIDAVTALSLLPITLRYTSLWLGAVMLIYALQFGLDAYYIVLERPLDPLHAWVNNANSTGVALALAVSTGLVWKRRRAAANEAALQQAA